MTRTTSALAVLALLAACGGSEPTLTIEEARAESAPRPAGGATTAERFGFESNNDPHGGTHPEPPPFAWSAPKAWTKQPPTRMRKANFLIGDDGTQCHLSVLVGAGGGVEANVNLWRKQMGLPPMGADAEGTVSLEVLGQTATLVELRGTYAGKNGEGQQDAALLGLICQLPGRVVFVKMTGPAASVDAERANFKAFLASLRVEG